ncbi:hypothetical protein OH779_20930 [Actinacidiphila glaucinigra]|uniref:hypothetical protein n=1 Tax=Actinacidiphila glaucinigra TaxID=235986 RepID=UPI003490E5F5
MAVSISVVLLLIVITLILLRAKSLKVSHAILCVLLGFCLASSSLAPTIHSGLVATTDAVSDLRP